MAKVLKAGGVWLAMSVVVWLITIWRWQNNEHDASAADIVSQLFVLPLVLTAALLGALWGVQRLRDKAASPIAAPTPKGVAAGQGAAAAAPLADEALRQAGAWVLAESVLLSAGADAQSVLGALKSRSVRPELDPELQDVEGMPVFSGRVPDLDQEEWLQAHPELAPEDGVPPSVPVLRGLALLDAPLHQMLDAIGLLVPRGEAGAPAPEHDGAAPGARSMGRAGAADEPVMKAHLSGVATQVPRSVLQSREAMAPQLTVRLLLPAHWPEAERDAAVAWVRSQCGGLLDWAEAAGAKGLRWVTEVLAQPEGIWAEVDQHIVQWSRQARPELLLILAVDSAVHAPGIERMQAQGELFTATHQSGKVPGEAAVGLLLANEHWPDLALLENPPVRLWRPARTRREKSADAAGRVGTTALSAALNHAVGLQSLSKDVLVQDKLMVVSDADQRASRGAELFESLQDALPGLDPMLAVARVGEACGDLGLPGALAPAALACGALRAGDGEGRLALATHVQSSHERVVVALAPWTQPAPQA